MSELIGVAPEYAFRETDAEVTDIEQRLLDHEEACRKVAPKRDWRGNIIEDEPVADVPAEPVQAFDPSEHTVEEVEAFLAENPDRFDEVMEMERNGKARVSLVGAEPSADPE